jgi:methylated-DNA-[protein]-cysteine S-methyltransferase
MNAPAYTLFDTAIGRCGIAWGERGIVRVQLPERGKNGARDKLVGQFPGAFEGEPPAPIRRALDLVVRLLKGEAPDLSVIPLDMSRVPAFHRRIYESLRQLKPGETLSYGGLAAKAGQAKAARAVGQAMRRNPFPLIVPCHRVLGSGGKLGGYTADGGRPSSGCSRSRAPSPRSRAPITTATASSASIRRRRSGI